MKVADELSIDLDEKDVQQVNRVEIKKNPKSKLRSIIARFISYKKRNEYIQYIKFLLKESSNYDV